MKLGSGDVLQRLGARRGQEGCMLFHRYVVSCAELERRSSLEAGTKPWHMCPLQRGHRLHKPRESGHKNSKLAPMVE